MSAYETIELVRRDGVAQLTLNRPRELNAWNALEADELRAAITSLHTDDEVRVVLITGAGRAFSAGADVREGFPTTADGYWDIHTRLVGVHHPIITGVRDLPKPVVAALNGPAAGIGCSLALACDLVIMAESAYLMLAFVRIGLALDGGASAFVPGRVGHARAMEMALLGEAVSAPQALDWGLVNRVVPDAEVMPAAIDLCSRLAAGPTKAYAAIKRQVNNWTYGQLADQLRFEADEQQALAATEDHREGVAAFLEKRAAGFSGR